MESQTLYMLHAGFVISKSDGQQHFINESQLRKLYKLKFAQCVNFMSVSQRTAMSNDVKIINLYPRYDGNYTIKQQADTYE